MRRLGWLLVVAGVYWWTFWTFAPFRYYPLDASGQPAGIATGIVLAVTGFGLLVSLAGVLLVRLARRHPATPADRFHAARAWFDERGFGFVIEEAEGFCWASLTPKGDARVVVPRYGRGATPEEAAQSAKDRYISEELASTDRRASWI